MPGLPEIPGLPDWLSFLLLLAGLAFGLAFLAMPFAVFGVKSRLEAIEQRLVETEETMRALARQVAAQPGGLSRVAADVEDLPIGTLGRPRPRAPEPLRAGGPPVPPPPVVPKTTPVAASRPELRADTRTEPRIEWPRGG